MSKNSMTLNLSSNEMDVLERLAEKRELSKTVLIRQALRLYQKVDERVEAGEKLVFEDERSDKKTEFVLV